MYNGSDSKLIGYEVEEGQGPTQIAQDLNQYYSCELACEAAWTQIVYDNATQFQNVFDGNGNIDDEYNGDYKSGNIDPGDVLEITFGKDVTSGEGGTEEVGSGNARTIGTKPGGTRLESEGSGNTNEGNYEGQNPDQVNVDGISGFNGRVDNAAKSLRSRPGSKIPHDTVNQWSYKPMRRDTKSLNPGEHRNYMIRNEKGETLDFIFFKKSN